MPKRQRKTREERIAEQFFPVDEDDLKYAIEKKYQKPNTRDLERIERLEKKPKKRKTKTRGKRKTRKTTKKTKRTRQKVKEFKPKKIKLKKNGYELIITEKPQAAGKIASSLGRSVKKAEKGVPYYEVDRGKKRIIVACAVGHLFTLSQKSSNSGSKIPIFDIVWVPNHFIRKNDFSKKYYDVLLKLIRDAGAITVATDYDIEGEVIGLNVVRFIANQEDASRMKFSTLTEKELNKSYEEKYSSINWGQAIAGETRHFLDWFYGINLSRALMNAIRTTGSFRIISIGRVQGPTLNLIVKKEKQILNFKAKPYWQVFIKLENGLELIHNKDIFKKTDLKKFENIKGKTGNAEIKKTEKELPPNPPFNLTSLQTEAYKLYKINPGKTLQIAQNLYLSGLISYPRTSSQKLPAGINYKEILNKLSKRYKTDSLLAHTRERPIEGKKSDPAHPSIYPTGNFQNLTSDEKKVYDLIAKRFLSLFMENAVIENKVVKVNVDNLIFSKKGSTIKKKSWLQIYPAKIPEKHIPDTEGEVKIINVRIEEKETQPPKRYSPASIVSELEKRNLGTKATRSSILETLYDRDYIRDQSIKATPLGISLIETLEKYSPIIIDEALTREFEREMEAISTAKKNYKEKEEKVINKAKETITSISAQFKTEESKIGKELLEANLKLRKQQKEEGRLQTCPVCKTGFLQITYSKKTGRYFVACDAYPKCKNTYTLPKYGLIKKTEPLKHCDKCGWPILMSIRKGKRPWEFCFNPDCETNKARIEAYKKKQAENKTEGQ